MTELNGPRTLMCKKAASDILAISVRHLDNLISASAIEVVRIGRSVRISPQAVEAFVKTRTQKAK